MKIKRGSLSYLGAFERNAGLALKLAVLGMGLYATSSYATTVTYNDFSSTAGLTTVGSTRTATTSDGTVLRLTPSASNQSGAAYSTSAVTLGANATFSTTFQFRFTNPGGINPADGITFVLAANPTGLGANGGGLGYAGVANSVAVEFDTFNNGYSSNHVGIDTNGNLTDYARTNVYGVSTCDFSSGLGAGCMSNGDLWTATLGYDGTSLTARLYDPAMGSTFAAITNYNINIASLLGTNQAYVGFTGSTGAGYENQDIVNWRFSNTTQLLSPVPEPKTYAMLLSGLGLIGFIAFRRSKGGHGTMAIA